MKITTVAFLGIAVMLVAMIAIAGYVQGQYDTVPEGATWIRQVLTDAVAS